MKLNDKDAVEQVKTILKNCSPVARKAIQALLTNPTQATAPAPRSISTEAMKFPDLRRPGSELARIPTPVAGAPAGPGPSTPPDMEEDWLNNWIKP